MNLGSSLLLIYSDQAEFHEQNESVIIRFAISEDQIFEMSELKELISKNQAAPMSCENFPIFNNIPELQKAAFFLCEGLQKEKVCMIALSALNNLIEHSDGLEQILQQIPAASTVLQNVELIEKKRSLFSRLLGD